MENWNSDEFWDDTALIENAETTDEIEELYEDIFSKFSDN